MTEIKCKLCNGIAPKIEHANANIFDIYACTGCQAPTYQTRYRMIFHKNDPVDPLAITIRLDDYYIILNYGWNFGYPERKTKRSIVYKRIIGELYESSDLDPITWDSDSPVLDFNFIIELPQGAGPLKQKLQIYTLFS